MIRRSLVFLGVFLCLVPRVLAQDVGDTRILVRSSGPDGDGTSLTVADIEAVGIQEVQAYNPYEKRSDTYSGVWMQQFVDAFGLPQTRRLTTRAIDDYEITFERRERESMRILIATRVNGTHIDFDEKGPMRIVFPDYDETSERYRTNLPKWTWMITEVTME